MNQCILCGLGVKANCLFRLISNVGNYFRIESPVHGIAVEDLKFIARVGEFIPCTPQGSVERSPPDVNSLCWAIILFES